MNAQQLKNSILQEAIEGRLVPQDPNDEPASVLLDKIRKEKARLVKEGKLKKKANGNIPWLRTGELNNGYVFDSEIKVTQAALDNCSLADCIEDMTVRRQFELRFPEYPKENIIPIHALEALKQEGGLHCCSWNILK